MTGKGSSSSEARYSFVRCWRRWVVKAIGGSLTVVSLVMFLIVLYRFIAPPTTPLMLLRSMQGYRVQYDWVSFYSIAPVMRRAVIVAEDYHFCDEPTGFDFHSMEHELEVWRDGGRPLGASTITMQTARSLFLLPGRSWLRNWGSYGSRRRSRFSGPGSASSRFILISWSSDRAFTASRRRLATTSVGTLRT